jgi:uracil-DNA glycosylase
MSSFDEIYAAIDTDPANVLWKQQGYGPLYAASERAKIVIVGQAPGRIAQTTRKPWNDVSGVRLRDWLGIDDEVFYDPGQIALIPMDFYYPGKGVHGDLPPRKDFAAKWHPQLLRNMPDVKLFILVGSYAQKYYLGPRTKPNLTTTVASYEEYLPTYLPLVHPSPLNFRWLRNNPWFEQDLIPGAKKLVTQILAT